MSSRPIRSFLGDCHAYLRRLKIWANVAWQVTGISANDKQTLRKALVRSPIKSLTCLGEWRDPTVDENCHVETSLGRFAVRANSDDLYLVLPSREPAVLNAIRRLLRPGDCFIDAGANIGIYTILASRLVGDQGKVIAVEMMPDTAEILRGHLLDNCCANVAVVQRALSNVAGQDVIASVEQAKFGSASIAVPRDGHELRVSTTTLENVIGNIPHVRLIKMDLEGAELAAANGLEPVLNRVDAVIFEDWGASAISAWFREKGFDISRLDPNNALAKSQSFHESEVPTGSH